MEKTVRQRTPAAVREEPSLLLVQNHFIIVIIRRTSLAPWEFEFPFPGSLTSAFLPGGEDSAAADARGGAGGALAAPRPRRRGTHAARGTGPNPLYHRDD